MSSNKERLGSVLSGRMAKTAGAAVPTVLELGTIGSNYSLTPDSLKAPIPKGDYMIDITLTGKTYRTSEESHSHDGGSHSHSGGSHGGHDSGDGSHSHSGGEHSHSGGAHKHDLPGVFRGVKPGDRVLMAWCGTEPVVVAVVVSS